MSLSLQQILVIAIPLIGVILPGILKQDGFSNLTNSLIAGVVVIGASLLHAWQASQLGVNAYLDFAVVAGGIAAMLNGPLRGLDEFLTSNFLTVVKATEDTVLRSPSYGSLPGAIPPVSPSPLVVVPTSDAMPVSPPPASVSAPVVPPSSQG